MPNFRHRIQALLQREAGFLLRGASISFVIGVLTTGLAFVERFVLARLLGPDTFGEYTIVWSWASVLLFVGTLGIGTTSLRYVAKYASQSEWALLRGFLGYSYRRTLVCSLLVSGGMGVVLWLVREQFERGFLLAFVLAAVLLPFMAFAQVLSQQLLSFKQVVMANAPLGFLRSLLLLTGLIPLALLLPTIQAYHVILVNVLVVGLLLILCYIYLQQRFPAVFHQSPLQFARQEWGQVARQFAFIDFLNIFNQRVDILILGFLPNPAEAGIFAVALSLTLLIQIGITSVNSIVAPLISELYTQNKLEQLQKILTLSAVGITAYMLVATLPLIIFGREILALFDPSFVAGYPALLVLLLGRVFYSLSGSTGFLMTMTSYEKTAGRILLFSTTISVLVTLLLIPSLGMLGAALGNVLRTIITNGLMYLVIRSRLKLEPTILSIRRLRWALQN